MDVRAALKGQYHAGLDMLGQVIRQCPDDLWTAGDRPSPFWQIAYHAVFYTHLYLQPGEKDFQPWEQARKEYQYLESVPWPPHNPPKLDEPYTKEQVLAYRRACDAMIDDGVDRLDLDAAECGFPWYDMPKLDHQMMNLRHLQHHVAQLADRLPAEAAAKLRWVGPGPS